MVSMQIAHDPLVRKCVRETFYERAKTTLRPTKKGVKEIDESHPCYTFKYLKNKPIRDLHEEQFMRIHQAEQDGLLTYEIHIDERDNLRLQDYFDEIKQLYIKVSCSLMLNFSLKLLSCRMSSVNTSRSGMTSDAGRLREPSI